MKNGESVKAFEREFAAYVGAKYAIALNSGTSTLHTALVALGVKPGDRVAVPPLTMAATTIAVLHAGAVPVFVDVSPATWLMVPMGIPEVWEARGVRATMPVSLFGLHAPLGSSAHPFIDDAAQTLRPHSGAAFTSYSFQASKILSLGEGGMLVTNDEALATRAREFSSLGYRMRADQPRIDPKVLKSPTFERHHSLGFNYRMADVVAAEAMRRHDASLRLWDQLRAVRQECADRYRDAIVGCEWLTPQHVPNGFTHDYWTFAVATDTPERCLALLDAVERFGGERPYPAWRLTYHEPAFRHLAPAVNIGTTEAHGAIRDDAFFGPTGLAWNYSPCPVAESLQPRLVQFQTNDLSSAIKNAAALRKAIEELS